MSYCAPYNTFVRSLNKPNHLLGSSGERTPSSMFRLSEDGHGLDMRVHHLTPDIESMENEPVGTTLNLDHHSKRAGSIKHADGSRFVDDYINGPREPQSLLEHNLIYELLCMPDDVLPSHPTSQLLDKTYHTCMPALVYKSPYVLKKKASSGVNKRKR
jgi:hypothetical protein